ncbi:MAG: LEPR-XLL domain-containing protein [Phycisphaerae bacterium]|jgi:hypothetical protein|nr:LEPR-XLL domain-containing protein [Phycisphaerae bacterium]MDP7287659.1 LEPR-XLL domain-containing protein [Phycisphaerae bacterium]
MSSASCKYGKGAFLEALEPRLLLSGAIAEQLLYDLGADGVMAPGGSAIMRDAIPPSAAPASAEAAAPQIAVGAHQIIADGQN